MVIGKNKKNYNLVLRILGLVFGASLLWVSVSSFGGVEKVLYYLRLLGFGYVFVVANSFIGVMIFCLAWYVPLKEFHPILSYWQLLKVRLCGESVNFMTPLDFAAGDPVRVLLLRKYLGEASHLRFVAMDRVLHLIAAYVFCLIGSVFMIMESAVFPLWLAVSFFTLYGLLVLVMTSFLLDMLQGNGFGFFENILKKLTILKKFPKVSGSIDQLRKDFSYYTNKPKGPFVASFLIHFAGRFLGAVEIGLIIYLLSGQVAISFAFMLGSLSTFFSAAFSFIPGALGVMEAVYAQFYLWHGLSPELGLSIQVVRRLRVLFWIVVGVFILDYHDIASHWKRRKVSV